MVIPFRASRPRRFPLWLSRFHSWWFIAQVGANVAAAWFFVWLIGEQEFAELGLGLLLGQGFLASVWLGLGGLPNVARFVSVFFVTLLAALVVSDSSGTIWNWEQWADQASQVFIVCFFMVLLFHGLLLPLRGLLGWRVDFDPAYHSREQKGRLQIGVVHILGWTTFVAIPCAIIRLMPAEDGPDIGIACLMISAMTLPVAATFALAVVAKRTWLWALLALIVGGITCTAEYFIPNLVFEEHFWQFNAGVVASVAGNLLILRCFGLRLFSVIAQTVPAAAEVASHAQAVQPPHFHTRPAPQWAEANAGRKNLRVTL